MLTLHDMVAMFLRKKKWPAKSGEQDESVEFKQLNKMSKGEQTSKMHTLYKIAMLGIGQYKEPYI